jgi:hypothetical protein
MELNCTLDHKHTKLTSFTFCHFGMTETSLQIMWKFFKNGHASQLEHLALNGNEIPSHGSLKLCEGFNNGQWTFSKSYTFEFWRKFYT